MSLRLRTALAAIVAASLVLGVAACGDDELTPEEARYQRVEELFRDAFGDEQAECMLRQFDDEMIASLDGPGALPEGEALDEFSAVARACVTGEDAPVPPGDDAPPTTESEAGEGSTPEGADPTEPDDGAAGADEPAGTDTTEEGSGSEEAPTSTEPDTTTTTATDG